MATLRTNTVFADRNVTVLAVESVESVAVATDSGCRLVGNIKPVAVVVRSADGIRALDMDAEPLDIDRLTATNPELRDALAGAGRRPAR